MWCLHYLKQDSTLDSLFGVVVAMIYFTTVCLSSSMHASLKDGCTGGLTEKHEVIFHDINVHVTFQDMPPPARSIASISLLSCLCRSMRGFFGVFC